MHPLRGQTITSSRHTHAHTMTTRLKKDLFLDRVCVTIKEIIAEGFFNVEQKTRYTLEKMMTAYKNKHTYY